MSLQRGAEEKSSAVHGSTAAGKVFGMLSAMTHSMTHYMATGSHGGTQKITIFPPMCILCLIYCSDLPQRPHCMAGYLPASIPTQILDCAMG